MPSVLRYVKIMIGQLHSCVLEKCSLR